MANTDIRPVALVTGCQRGIGRAIAVALADAGFDIAANDREPSELLSETLRLVEAKGARAAAFPADIADLAAHEGLLERASADFGRLDCLVNNAGVSVLARGDLLEVSPESWDRCLSVNTRGPFFLSQRFARRLLEAPRPAPGRHRSLIFVTSVNAAAASVNRGEYCVSKAGLGMVSKLFALRLAEHGVGVYEIRPGIIATDMTAPVKESYDRAIADGVSAIRRWGQPEDVAAAVATVAQGRLPFTVGETIHVDGGLLLPRL